MTDIVWNGMQHISDKWIAEADEDTVRKHFRDGKDGTKKNNAKRFSRNISRMISIAACVCICICAVTMIHFMTKQNDNSIIQVNSPITYVSSGDEMTKYLGFSVPLLTEKEATEFILYASDDNYAYMGRINYSDGTGYRMSRGSGDISGIYGGNLNGTADIDSVTVYYYEMSGRRYAIWNVKGYACCYYAADSETDLTGIIGNLIRQIKK